MIIQRQMNGTPYSILVPSDDVHGLYMAENGQHDLSWSYVLRNIKPGDIVVDVGAHVGLFSLLACAKGAHVVAVEPAPSNLACLKKLTDINPGLNLQVVEAAASDKQGVIAFAPNGPHGHVALGGESDVVNVSTLRLDSLSLKDVALVKIDVEGHELAVLDGMSGCRVPLLLCESNGHSLYMTGNTTDDLRQKLERYGYTNYRLHQDGAVVPTPVGEIQPECVVDLISVPSGLAHTLDARPKLSSEEMDEWVCSCKEAIETQQLGSAHRNHLERELSRRQSPLKSGPAKN